MNSGWQQGAAERSIDAFERIHGLIVTVHDLTGTLAPFLRSERFYHRSPLCVAVKAHGRHEACVQFDVEQLRPSLAHLPEGRVHVCPAGLVEWVVPAFSKDKLAWVLFAGPRLPGADLSSAFRASDEPPPRLPRILNQERPREVLEQEALWILEHLRQLAARLKLGIETAVPLPDHAPADSVDERQLLIARFIEEKYAQPVTLAMLAEALNLSESRASHVVRQACRESFRDLLVEKRLRVAMELLRQSGMRVQEVATASGFDDVAHFHRLFRRRVGHTPAQHRIHGQS